MPVLIQKNADQYDRSDLVQNWKNGSEFLFLDAKEDVAELMALLKEEGTNKKAVHFYFSNDADDSPPTSSHIVISASGYSDGDDAFQKACAGAQ